MRERMDRELRAKQFMPFSPLRGYEELIRQRGLSPAPRIVLGEDAQAELDERLRELAPGDQVRARHYKNGQYTDSRGHFLGLDPLRRFITIDAERISFPDLIELERL